MREKFCKYFDVISGYAFKSTDLKLCSDVPVIKIGNISNGSDLIEDDSTQYVSKDFLKINEKYHINKDDILISLTGSHINQPNSMVGRVCRSYSEKTYLLNQRAGKVIPKDDASKEYLFYLLSSKCIKEEIVNRAYGAANQVNISPSAIGNIKWDFPTLDTQKKIGELLSFFDKLIITNNKRIKMLEQMAEKLYKEWFVRFRFPGHEKVEFVDGVPKGWEFKRLSDIADIVMGQSPSSCYYNNNMRGLPFHQGVGSYGNRYLQDDVYSTEGKRIAEANSIIFSVRAPVGRLNITLNKIILGRGVAGINEKKGRNIFLYYLLNDKFAHEDLIGSGTIFSSVTKDELYKQKLLVPKDDICDKFDIISGVIEKEIRNIYKQNQNLIKQRDYLLPRLMSGKIKV